MKDLNNIVTHKLNTLEEIIHGDRFARHGVVSYTDYGVKRNKIGCEKTKQVL